LSVNQSSINNLTWRCVETGKKNEVKVIAEILRVAAKGSKEGEILDRCKLDATALDNYISALDELNWLTIEDNDEICYRTTEKGLEFLNTYHKLRWLLLGKDNDFTLMRLLGQIKRREKNPFYVS
jgi:predicted transcriptional regulator